MLDAWPERGPVRTSLKKNYCLEDKVVLKEYAFKYGKGEIKFQVDTDNVIGELVIKDYPVQPDPIAAIKEALRHPIGSPPLAEIVKPGQTVCLLVNDSTRVANSHVFLPVLLDELNGAGVPDDNIIILFALGTHHDLSEAEMVELVGQEVANRVRMYNSNAKKAEDFVYVGTTSRGTQVYLNKKAVEADHIICTGSIVYHFFAGFGGGRKALFPGVAAYESIRQNHSLMLQPKCWFGYFGRQPGLRRPG